MAFTELLSTPAVARALLVGAFGAVGLVLTVTYSRRGPMIYPVYAALLAALALLLSRYPALPYGARFTAALCGFVAASVPLVVATIVLAGRNRERLRAEGRLPPDSRGPTALGYLAPTAFLLAVGAIASAGVAFVAG